MASLKDTTIKNILYAVDDLIIDGKSTKESLDDCFKKSGGRQLLNTGSDIATWNGELSFNQLAWTKDLTDLPTNGVSYPYSTIANFGVIPQYSRGMHICNGGNKAMINVSPTNELSWGYGIGDDGVYEWPNGFLTLGKNKVLWSGTYWMSASHQVTLSEKISQQVNGIVLVWSSFYNNDAYNDNFRYVFVPKNHILDSNFAGKLVTMVLLTGQFATVASKGLYIGDTTITGHNDNSATGTGYNSGIKFDNTAFVLRKVLGV